MVRRRPLKERVQNPDPPSSPQGPAVLNDSSCGTAKCVDKPYQLADLKGLYLEVKPNCVKAWRYGFKLTQSGETKESHFA